jgi:hypothetical protein
MEKFKAGLQQRNGTTTVDKTKSIAYCIEKARK